MDKDPKFSNIAKIWHLIRLQVTLSRNCIHIVRILILPYIFFKKNHKVPKFEGMMSLHWASNRLFDARMRYLLVPHIFYEPQISYFAY